jgi:hypothetical protein
MANTSYGITADYMSEINVSDVSALFDLPLSEMVQRNEAISMSRPTALRPLAEEITAVLNGTGTWLKSMRIPTLGHFILTAAQNARSSAAVFVEHLTATVPTLADIECVDGTEVKMAQRAQELCALLYRQMRDRDPRFGFTDLDRLTVSPDVRIAQVLKKAGVLGYGDDVSRSALRAAAVVAGDMLVELLIKERNLDVQADSLSRHLLTL